MLGALIGASLADLRAQRANCSRMLAAARHGVGREATSAPRSLRPEQCSAPSFSRPLPWGRLQSTGYRPSRTTGKPQCTRYMGSKCGPSESH